MILNLTQNKTEFFDNPYYLNSKMVSETFPKIKDILYYFYSNNTNKELILSLGRRSGKDRLLATACCYEAMLQLETDQPKENINIICHNQMSTSLLRQEIFQSMDSKYFRQFVPKKVQRQNTNYIQLGASKLYIVFWNLYDIIKHDKFPAGPTLINELQLFHKSIKESILKNSDQLARNDVPKPTSRRIIISDTETIKHLKPTNKRIQLSYPTWEVNTNHSEQSLMDEFKNLSKKEFDAEFNRT